ncbi:glycosyltransferase (plasmid) [Deinococcus metallilatus]|uniref:Peptidoglycan/xylan/chitin deacetylase (PgdA/CDA1 family)/spore germination protein YaaH/glycosyltransferase involved in cell wall biosynthesis n=1 Tax=Deinococcus metallilatus TaxID=1211322 RepID=A0ABR6MUZ9_9DEIO|nr:glycosyltransferase [Deinococcus metallilatus]MBB5295756.1 peptidoglycan/xylan/chitin deacetylase (PgdA/CDA1 family)/spore germination protein YaaH/glycosyltransferase involved in cell wall biosynthesis [Deinococcus metallilatus]QBY06802.1 glycosyltransferase [Deinococcus metallilatus]GMA14285.1 glycosyl transferase family 2 [Deinococcus metallilatus]
MSERTPPVFSDPQGHRRRYLNRFAALLAGVLLLSGAGMVVALWRPDVLPPLPLAARPPGLRPLTGVGQGPHLRDTALDGGWTGARAPAGAPLNVTGFFVAWDDNSFSSLKRNLGALDVLVPEWWHLGPGGTLLPESPGKNANLRRYVAAQRPGLPVMPLVNNYDPDAQTWASARVGAVLHDPAARARLVRSLVAGVEQNGFAGLNVDFENLPDSAQGDYVTFIRELGGQLHAAGRRLTLDAPLDDPAFQYAALGRAADHVILMAYDEHEEQSGAGPVAAQGWVQRSVQARLKAIPAAHLTVALGSYGYDWTRGGPASELTFQDALSLARDANVAPTLDARTLNPTFGYTDDAGRAHTVWYLDAVSVFDQAQAVRALGVRNVALWRLGSEDPGVWPALKKTGADATRALTTLQAGYDIDYQGEGELLRVSGHPQAGSRTVTRNAASGLLTAEHLRRFATPYVIERWGAKQPRALALTFDDGPDPTYTPQLLDILKREQVPATFFIVGLHGEEHPELLRRMLAEGHEIGSHTFTHPDLGLVSRRQFDLELNATQRLLEGETGHRTLLFRPPFAEDVEPETPDQAGIVEHASRLGYSISGMGVDPNDWRRPGAGQIVSRVLVQVKAGDGHVILLHDGGGDRAQTVAALPELIARLRAEGYTFTTVSELAGIPRQQANPPVSPGQRWLARLLGVNFTALGLLGTALAWLFKVGVTLSVARLLLIVGLALRERLRRREPGESGGPLPGATVIVPAFNEARVIRATVASLLASDLPGLRVHVVDDGSTDGTAEVVRAAYGHCPQVTVERIPNGGKANALNHALTVTGSEVVILLDADTQVNPEAARRLVRHFLDPQVAAVAGNAKVGNRINLLTRWQALEYITAQNVERRALAQLNAIGVVPGAIGAWRREVLLGLGGFAHDTLAEDADLTLRALRAGHRVTYELGAVARTEAPDTLRAFLKQRDRWMFGTLQATWKQRGAFRSRSRGLGLFTLPNVLLFQVLFPLVGALLDLSFLTSLAWALLQWRNHPDGGFSPTGPVLLFTALFLLVDLLAAGIAFALEPGEDWRLLPLLLPQRAVYRQLMSYVAIRAVLNALQGRERGWGKLERKATVAPLAPLPAGD